MDPIRSRSNSKSRSKSRSTPEEISIEDIKLKMPSALPAKLTYSENVAKKMSKTFQLHNNVQAFSGCFYLSNLFYLYLFKKYKLGCTITNAGYGIEMMINFQNKQSVSINDEYIENNAEKIFRCIMRGDKIIIIPFMMQITYDGKQIGAHANLLIYRQNTGQLEHFEPHGAEYRGIKKKMIDKQRDKVLTKLVDSINYFIDYETNGSIPIVTLLKSYDVCPNIEGVQALEQQSLIPKNAVIEPGGYCVAWSMFFTELCLKNPEVPSRQIFEAVMEKTELYDNKNDYLRNVIRGYTCFINNKIAKHFSHIFGEPMSSVKIHSMIGQYSRSGIADEEITNYGDKLLEIMEVELDTPIQKGKSYPDVRDRYMEFVEGINSETSSSSLKSEERLSPPRSKIKSHSAREEDQEDVILFKSVASPKTKSHQPSSSKKNNSSIKDSMAKGLKRRKTIKNKKNNKKD